MGVPNVFGSATTAIPLSQLDANFNTTATLGNAAVGLGNTTTTVGNLTLNNVTINSVSTPITPTQGGTGLNTLTANNVIIGNGTGNVTFVAPGANANVLTSNGTAWLSQASGGGGTTIPAGTAMIFAQTAAPTGFTKVTTTDNAALRLVSGTAGSGGTVNFTTAFAANAVGGTTLSTAEIPSHNHTATIGNADYGSGSNNTATNPGNIANSPGTLTVSNTGGGGSHTHSFQSLAVKYVDVIIATKN
jgi:hypothetical protein